MSSITAEAPVFLGGGRIEVRRHVYRDPGPGELRIRIGANAICGTDRNEYFQGATIVPGHEAAGIVEAAGPDTTTAVGARGAIYLMDYCGTCRSCRVGATNQCTAKRQDTGQTSDGGYGPYALIHETQFFPIPDELPLVEATMLLDVMGTSNHALLRSELVRSDTQRILIAGAGPIGLGLTVMARIRYPEMPIVVTDISDWRRGLASELGASTLDARDADGIRDSAPDVAFDSSGKQVARESALRALTKRGVLVCVGHGEGLSIDVSTDLIAPERAILASEYFRFDEMPHNLATLLANRELIGRVITHRLPVEHLPEAFELFLGGETGKVVITQDVQ